MKGYQLTMADKDLDLLCIGNALVDVSASTDKETAARYGITGQVQHVEIEKIYSLLSRVPGYTAVSGGGAANVAKIAGLLGIRAGFIGAAGRGNGGAGTEADEMGQLFKAGLSSAGVNLSLSLKSSPTGICTSHILSGKNQTTKYLSSKPLSTANSFMISRALSLLFAWANAAFPAGTLRISGSNTGRVVLG